MGENGGINRVAPHSRPPYIIPRMPDSFVHLHLHTEYSHARWRQPHPGHHAAKRREFGMPAVAMTDHGNLFGAIEFYQEAAKAGIKPIIGCEMYMAPGQALREAGRHRPGSRLPFHPPGPGRDRLPQPRQARLHRPPRRHVLQAAHRQGSARPIQRRPHRHERLPQGRDQPGHPQRSAAESPRGPRSFVQILGRENFFLELHDHGIEAQQPLQRRAAHARAASSASASSRRTTSISSSAPITRRTT